MITKSDIKNKYKQIKYQHLKKIYEKYLSKVPTNWKYNKQIRLPNSSRINICSFNLEDSPDVDLCYKIEHSKPCNAFCPIKTKEQLYLDFMGDIKDDKERATQYKDINILYWMYPEILNEEFPRKTGLFSVIIDKIRNFLHSFF